MERLGKGVGMIQIVVNGKDWQVDSGSTIANLLGRIKLSPIVCVVEINGEIQDKKTYNTAALKNGDRVEIIRMMAGG